MDVVCLEHLETVSSSEDGGEEYEMAQIQSALKGLGMKGSRIFIRAAGELEKQKMINQDRLQLLKSFESYKSSCSLRGIGYYESFKLQTDTNGFNENLKRLVLAGRFDEIIEMIKRYALPDGFETRVEWVKLGADYRRLFEPLDIANYCRHSLIEDMGPSVIKGRLKCYKLAQQWLEPVRRLPAGSCLESFFWATVEELLIEKKSFEEMKETVLELEKQLPGWLSSGDMAKDVLVEGSTVDNFAS